ncbi:MAG: ATP-dependent DNA ligase [Candidatus Aenigmarchaeota archaeon]|nr:ATP-dependent DNA ligase [Candidatus Aenigmarchaeota archaeon]
MYYSRLADTYEELEKTPAKLKKSGIIARLLKESEPKEMGMIVLLLQGKVFPIWSEKELGIANLLMIKAISSATGFPAQKVEERFKRTGDLGLVVEELIKNKRQSTLFRKRLMVEKVFGNLQKIAEVEGKGSQDRKFQLVSEIIGSAEAKEAKYIVRTVLGELRVGVAEGIVRDAIAEAFFHENERKEAINAIEWGWFLTGDYGEIAGIAKEKGLVGLRKVRLDIGKPIQVLLAEKSPSLIDALESFDECAIEVKYDGARVQIHKKEGKIWLYTRRLENITKQFPDLVELVKKHVKGSEFIIEGEILAIDPKTHRPMTFQTLSQRIHRKYDIEETIKQIPIQVNLFDVIYLNGKSFFESAFKERRKVLESIISEVPGKFQLAEELITKDLQKAEKFYKKALEENQEGVMVKNLKALYQPGRRVAGGWLKVKPTMENLDLAIVGAQWGTGKRAGWMSSFVLGARDEKTGRFLECGMMGTGLKEKEQEREGDKSRLQSSVTFQNLTKMLKPYIESDKGSSIKIRPKVVVEVAYEEIQKSPNYESGYALRFPRILRIRFDKGIEQADTLKRLERLYEQQKK